MTQPKYKSVFNIHDRKGIKYLFQLRMNFSPLRSHKKQNSAHTPSHICACNQSIEETRHFLIECLKFASHRASSVVTVIDLLHRDNLSDLANNLELYLYGYPSLISVDNNPILSATIQYIKRYPKIIILWINYYFPLHLPCPFWVPLLLSVILLRLTYYLNDLFPNGCILFCQVIGVLLKIFLYRKIPYICIKHSIIFKKIVFRQQNIWIECVMYAKPHCIYINIASSCIPLIWQSECNIWDFFVWFIRFYERFMRFLRFLRLMGFFWDL